MNILWICADTLRYDALGCYGNRIVRTPNIDRLAAEGVLFERCYSQSPVCAPSRAAFLTGRYPAVCGQYQNGADIPASETLVTALLARAGFTGGLAGKLHLSAAVPTLCPIMERRIEDGYALFDWCHDAPRPDTYALDGYMMWLDDLNVPVVRTPDSRSRWIWRGMPREHHHTTWTTDRAIRFIRAHAPSKVSRIAENWAWAGMKDSRRPWFFSLNYFDPHDPYDPPADLLDYYADRLDEIPLPNYTPGELDEKPPFQAADHRGAYGNAHGVHDWPSMADTEHKMHTAAYYAMVELIDHDVGRLMHALRETNQEDDTLVVFTSDHGEMLGDHGMYIKGPYFYEAAVRVPLILRQPARLAAGLRSPAISELVDLPQTLLEAAGLEAPSGMMGQSLWGIATGAKPADAHKLGAFSEYFEAMPRQKPAVPRASMWTDGRHKLAVYHGLPAGAVDGELYDLEADPGETRNRWADPAYGEIKMRLMKALLDKWTTMRDPAYVRPPLGLF